MQTKGETVVAEYNAIEGFTARVEQINAQAAQIVANLDAFFARSKGYGRCNKEDAKGLTPVPSGSIGQLFDHLNKLEKSVNEIGELSYKLKEIA